ncbi:MAG: multicopper oxidase family protein [Rhizobiaceae bacterium]
MLAIGASALAATKIPGLALAKQADGSFELRAAKNPKKLAGSNFAASDLWLYNGESPGPEIRLKQGQRAQIRFINELDQPTSVHWHGIRIDNAMDGVSGLTQDPVAPGGTFDYDFVVPDSGTFWYHAHHSSWEQVARGLYGPLIVEEANPVVDRRHDFTLVIDDWRLADNGDLHLPSFGSLMDWSHAGRLGNWLTVNGQSQPRFQLNAGENYRLRLINASNARILKIDLKAMDAELLGTDGFLFKKPRTAPSGHVDIAPAQRLDLLINPQRPDNNSQVFPLQEISAGEPLKIADFVVANSKTTRQIKPTILPQNDIEPASIGDAIRVPLLMTGGAMGQLDNITYQGNLLERSDLQRTKQLWAFNGTANLAGSPLFAVKRGQSVVLEAENQTAWPHAMHIHGHHFQILSRNGVHLQNKDWRDTFIIDRDEKVVVAFVADNPGKWLLHCHMLEHAAAGMRTRFDVA